MQVSMMIGVAALAAALTATLTGAAQAQEQVQPSAAGGEGLSLLCMGTDATLMTLTPYLTPGRTAYSDGMYFGEGRTPAQLGVIVENGKLRVKPPKGSVPMFTKDSDDGWYELTDVSIDRLAIKGRRKWNRIDRSNLDVDRRTGAVTFGRFTGVCQRVSANPDATKF